jgi:hypothetical protein
MLIVVHSGSSYSRADAYAPASWVSWSLSYCALYGGTSAASAHMSSASLHAARGRKVMLVTQS